MVDLANNEVYILGSIEDHDSKKFLLFMFYNSLPSFSRKAKSTPN